MLTSNFNFGCGTPDNLVGSEDGASLQAELTDHVKHIRVCALPYKEFCSEVAPSRVLSSDEVTLVCVSLGTKQKQPELTQICNDVVPRRKLQWYTPSEPLTVDLTSETHGLGYHRPLYNTNTSLATITTKEHTIELISLSGDWTNPIPTRSLSECIATVKVKGPFMDENGSQTETEISADIYDREVELMNNGKRVQLLPHSDYSVNVTTTRNGCSFTHFSVTCHNRTPGGRYLSLIQSIKYKALMLTNTV